jgi:SAM-dependent methyltransferase
MGLDLETSTLPRSASRAYDAIAPAYDEFTHYNDHASWIDVLLGRLEALGLRKGRLLDVGCGTGKAFQPMLERNWEIVGCDISQGMLEVAKAKAGGRVELELADMRELPDFGQFDLVWALNDVVNYLVGDGELVRALAGMRRNLGRDGLVLFDCNSLATLRTGFSAVARTEHEGRRWTWTGLSSDEAKVGSIFEARVEGDDIAPHVHRERHFGTAEVQAAMGSAGLECVTVVGQREGAPVELVDSPDELRDAKVVYVGRAPSG